jgi:hypothetical protein
VRAVSPDGEIRTATVLGDLVAKAPESSPPLSEGTKVWVSIRPECIALAASGAPIPPGANVLTGVLDETTYLGELAEHRFRSGEQRLRAYELNPVPGSGARVATLATIAPSDVVLLPFDGGHV